MHGHCIIFPQSPDQLIKVLLPSLDEVVTPMCVVFVGSQPPSQQWLRVHAKPLLIHRNKVHAALLWLKKNNPLYADIEINVSLLQALDHETVAPVNIETHAPSVAECAQGSCYDFAPPSLATPDTTDTDILQNVVVTGVDMDNASSVRMRAAAVRHLKSGKPFVEMQHGAMPSSEYGNPTLFPLLYPSLFPYGTAGFDIPCTSKLGLEAQARHFFSLNDRRFQEHFSFLFIVFNMLQRHAASIAAKIKTSSSKFSSLAKEFSSISESAIEQVLECVVAGDQVTANNDEEVSILKLMCEVSFISAKVPGSAATRTTLRNEIRALMYDIGLPSFFITINPADCYAPLVQFLAGKDIDIDNLLPDQVPSFWDQSILVAKNPFVASQFFNEFISAFISEVLGFNIQDPSKPSILGSVKGYYGCVEAQGRGTLHCHMLIWIDNSLDPQEIHSVHRNLDKIQSEKLKLYTFKTCIKS